MSRTHDGQGIVLFSSAAVGRGVHSMVIACVPGSKLGRLGCFTTDEESVGLDYKQDWLVGLDHERDSSWGHSKVPRPSFMHMTHEGI